MPSKYTLFLHTKEGWSYVTGISVPGDVLLPHTQNLIFKFVFIFPRLIATICLVAAASHSFAYLICHRNIFQRQTGATKAHTHIASHIAHTSHTLNCITINNVDAIGELRQE